METFDIFALHTIARKTLANPEELKGWSSSLLPPRHGELLTVADSRPISLSL